MEARALPKTFLNIISGEFAERCSFYSITVLTPLYLTQFFAKTSDQASGVMYQFNTISYLMCILGGLMADWYLGRYRTLILFAWFTVIGHLLLGFSLENYSGFMVGLFCIAIGTSFIKPNVSSLLGDQYGGGANEASINKAFNWFYLAINAGSIFSFTLSPILPGIKGIGWAGAYAFPAAMMTLALIMLWLGRKNYIRIPPTGTPKTTFIGMNIRALRLYLKTSRAGVWAQLETTYGPEKVDSVQAVWRVSIFFLFVTIALSVYFTNGIDWLLDAQNPNMIKNFFGLELAAGQLQTVNPICILTFIPLSVWLFPRIERATGNALNAKRKMLLGFILLLVSILLESWVSHQLDLNQQVHAIWQVLALIILSAAEVLVLVTGLQYGYTHAPKSMKSTIGAIWLLTIAMGNALNAMFKNLANNHAAFSMLKCNTNFYWTLSILLVINIILFWLVMPRLKEKIYV